jgi:uncharacterized protein
MKKYIPYAYSDSLFEISPDFFKKIGVKYLICDLDNTLDSHKQEVPSERTKEYLELLKENNLIPVIISNNTKKRVGKYCESLNLLYIYSALKPFTKNTRKFLKENDINPDECIMIGDQLMTDIKCANKIGIKSILTENVASSDQIVTRWNKLFDKPIRNRLKKKELLINWRTIYGRIK